MSLRQGVTTTEESQIKKLIEKGKSWDDILELCEETETQRGLLTSVDLAHVKTHIFEPLKKQWEAHQKAGHKTFISAEQAAAKAKKKPTADDDDDLLGKPKK
jgi:hypothetical protein